MALDPTDVGEFQNALNDTAGKASVLWTTFITFEVYLLITFGSVSHRDLLLETPIKLPLLNVDLPLIGFFIVAPILLLILHFYVFLQLFAFTTKSHAFDSLLCQVAKSTSDREYIRQRLDSFLILQFLVGPAEQRAGLGGTSLRLIAWFTLVGAPLVILMQGQVTFLPFQFESVEWIQRIVIILDSFVVWFFWNRIRRDDRSIIPFVDAGAWKAIGFVLIICIVVSSICIATFPGEKANEYLPTVRVIPVTWWPHWSSRADWASLHEMLFAGAPDEVNGRPSSLFSNRLVLTDQSFVDPDKLDKVEVSSSFRGRILRSAILNRADLRKADFTGAMLDGASFKDAKLEGANFSCVDPNSGSSRYDSDGGEIPVPNPGVTALRNANFRGARLQGATFVQARLQGAEFFGANLRGVDFGKAHLQGADLGGVDLDGAELGTAELQRTNFVYASLRGANLFMAQLQVADLRGADLQGAHLEEAGLQGANLDQTQMQAASLAEATIWRSKGIPILSLANLDKIDAVRTPWDATDISPASSFAVWREGVVSDIADRRLAASITESFSVLDKPMVKQEDPLNSESWISEISVLPQGEDRLKAMAAFLGDLSCATAGAPFVARSILRNRGEEMGGQLAIFASKLGNARWLPNTCPGVKGFGDDDWAFLESLAPLPIAVPVSK